MAQFPQDSLGLCLLSQFYIVPTLISKGVLIEKIYWTVTLSLSRAGQCAGKVCYESESVFSRE